MSRCLGNCVSWGEKLMMETASPLIPFSYKFRSSICCCIRSVTLDNIGSSVKDFRIGEGKINCIKLATSLHETSNGITILLLNYMGKRAYITPWQLRNLFFPAAPDITVLFLPHHNSCFWIHLLLTLTCPLNILLLPQ